MRGAWGSSFFVAAALVATPARADGTLATPCGDDPWRCATAPIAFGGETAIPIEFDFDTGWVPQNSDLQVHLWGGLWAHTRVSLAGSFDASWPDALELAAPGDPLGGLLAYHYGVEVGAEGMVNISVFGQTYTWVGDLPYVPQVDVQVKGGVAFDAWAFDPGISLPSSTKPQKVAQIGIGDLIGGSIPGIDGGFELDVALDVEATYVTERIVVADPGGQSVAGGPILSEGAVTSMVYEGGPHVDLDVHPEGRVDYEGTVHLIPAFYVELLGQNWNIPIADIPIGFPIASVPWVFEAARVHVPLPDVVVPETLDFGQVDVGAARTKGFTVDNLGESGLHATVLSGLPKAFTVHDAVLLVDPMATGDGSLTFHPVAAGEIETLVYVATNDPDVPLASFVVRGEGVGLALADAPPPAAIDAPEADGGCACRAAGDARRTGPGCAWLALGAATLCLALRRRRPRRRSRALEWTGRRSWTHRRPRSRARLGRIPPISPAPPASRYGVEVAGLGASGW